MNDKCRIKECKGKSFLIYYGKKVCEKHWIKYCNGKINLKKELRIKSTKALNT